ncbi:hypothetical protein FACS189491_10490 [Spirochaetia bacterium]|nr:hypothetical protein FACS189491_10490 [Spirochaetia bacterium]
MSRARVAFFQEFFYYFIFMDDKTALLEAKHRLVRLTDLFAANYAQYMSAGYDESNTRTDFIDGFFEEALDWDVRNKEGASEVYRDVVREDKVKINGQTKAPDYAFRIGGIVKFYVEAKKPSVNIKDNPEPAYQVRRYAWTKKLPLSILTNMREFAVYDTRVKPAENDKASAARIFYCTFKEYEQRLEFIYNTFSKQGIRSGSFDKYIEENKNKKGTGEVDSELLSMVEEWRMELAKNIALRNTAISIYNLNTVVQKIIDRIVFLRIAEDKGIEDADLLKTIAQCKDVYTHLNQLFVNANNKYNAGLFKTEEWIEKVQIDDTVLRSIIVNLYYPKSPYEFSVLPIEILGNIYEKFLGKTITFRGVKGGHTAVIEEKPEVKKAGGVYYTPQYIVDYIVQNTVGVLIKDKTPDEIAVLRFVDPACGSGSFLVGAYQYLLNYHLDYYTGEANVKSALKKEKIYEATHGAYKLTIAEKQKILQNNIYGVDIDSQAVEVTKLSLYLKLLENEGKEAEGQLFKFTDMKLLPSLENNIKCGNSLIGTDFYTSTLDFDEEMARKVNCFDWENEFPGVFGNLTTKDTKNTKGDKEKNLTAKDAKGTKEEKDGGFDVVLGNPPYVNAKALVELLSSERNYLSTSQKYKYLYQKWDLYVAFLEKSLNILKGNGYLSMIIPYPFLNQTYGNLLRQHLMEKHKIVSILDLSNRKIFKDAVVTNIVMTIQTDGTTNKIQIAKINDDDNIIYNAFTLSKKTICQTSTGYSGWKINLNTKINIDNTNFYTLGDICFISIGMVLNADEKTAKGKFIKKDLISNVKTAIHSQRYTEAKFMNRYEINKVFYLEWGTSRVPAKIRRPTFVELYENQKILINKLGVLKATFDDSQIYCDQTIRVAILWKHLKGVQNNSINNSVVRYLEKNRKELEIISQHYTEKFLLGIINSNIGKYFLNQIRGEKNIDINPDYLKQIPIPKLDLSIKTDKAAHDNLVALVDKMLELKKREHDEPNPQTKTVIERQIGAVDGQIDEAVYRLYGLGEKEIKVVEGER